MQAYFARHNESLGWNTAFANGVALIFVVFDLMRRTYGASQEFLSLLFSAANLPHTLVIAFLFLYALFVLSINFFRLLPDYLSFFLSSYPVTTGLAYVAIAIVYSEIQLSEPTALAILVFYSILFLALFAFKTVMGKVLLSLFPSKGENLEREFKRKLGKGEIEL